MYTKIDRIIEEANAKFGTNARLITGDEGGQILVLNHQDRGWCKEPISDEDCHNPTRELIVGIIAPAAAICSNAA